MDGEEGGGEAVLEHAKERESAVGVDVTGDGGESGQNEQD